VLVPCTPVAASVGAQLPGREGRSR
jgi:hypothetical protein